MNFLGVFIEHSVAKNVKQNSTKFYVGFPILDLNNFQLKSIKSAFATSLVIFRIDHSSKNSDYCCSGALDAKCIARQ